MAHKQTIGIIGLGMIGGSLALALKDRYAVVGYDIDDGVREYARANVCGVADSVADMRDCLVVFVCVPVAAMRETLVSVRAALGEGVIITDVASVKTPFAGVCTRYVGGHPMAGRERGGIEQAKAHLFENAYYCITDSGEDADIVRAVVEKTGAIPIFMTASEHDRAVSAFSHVPHAVAYASVTAALGESVQPIAGSGFMDSTRIAQSDERFWTEVFKLNRDNVRRGIKAVTAELDKIDGMLEGGDDAALIEYLAAARQKRIALNRVDLGGEELYVDLVDRIGEFERVTGALAHAGINVTNIALVPARTGANGALRLEFGSVADKLRAMRVLGLKEE